MKWGGGDVVRDIAFKREREEEMFPAVMVPRLLQEKVKRWEVQKVRRWMTNGLSGYERTTQVVQQFTQITHCLTQNIVRVGYTDQLASVVHGINVF
jgi:hypothetical protein